MPDNLRKRGRPDRQRAAGKQQHEINYLAQYYGTTPTNVRRVIERVGHIRNAVVSALAKNAVRRNRDRRRKRQHAAG